MTTKVSFFTPVKSDNSFMSAVEGYLSLSKERAVVVQPLQHNGNSLLVTKQVQENSCAMIALKVASYILTLGLLPLIALVIKAVHRCSNEYHYSALEVAVGEVRELFDVAAILRNPIQRLERISNNQDRLERLGDLAMQALAESVTEAASRGQAPISAEPVGEPLVPFRQREAGRDQVLQRLVEDVQPLVQHIGEEMSAVAQGEMTEEQAAGNILVRLAENPRPVQDLIAMGLGMMARQNPEMAVPLRGLTQIVQNHPALIRVVLQQIGSVVREEIEPDAAALNIFIHLADNPQSLQDLIGVALQSNVVPREMAQIFRVVQNNPAFIRNLLGIGIRILRNELQPEQAMSEVVRLFAAHPGLIQAGIDMAIQMELVPPEVQQGLRMMSGSPTLMANFMGGLMRGAEMPALGGGERVAPFDLDELPDPDVDEGSTLSEAPVLRLRMPAFAGAGEGPGRPIQ